MKKKYDKPRPSISNNLKEQVRCLSGHRCAVKYCKEPIGDIHHIDGNRENNSIDNLIFLCKTHHDHAHRNMISKESLVYYKHYGFYNGFCQKIFDDMVDIMLLYNWRDIMYDLELWEIQSKYLKSFKNGYDFLNNIKSVIPNSELDILLNCIKKSLNNFLILFQGDHIVLSGGKFQYFHWRTKEYSQEEYRKMYENMQKWQENINEAKTSLMNSLNNFLEFLWKYDVDKICKIKQNFY